MAGKKKVKDPSVDEKVLENLGGTADEPKVVEETKVEEPVVEVTKEETKVETPQIDVEKLKEDLKGDVTKEVTEKIVDALADKPEATQDKYDKFVADYTAKNGAAPAWKVMADFIKEEAKAEINADIEADNKIKEEAKVKEDQSVEEYNKNINTYWQAQEADLESKGIIPPIQSEDVNDPGRQARIKIYQKLDEVDKERQAKGESRSMSIKEIMFDYPDLLKNDQPGADAPISRGTRVANNDTSKTFSYTDLKPGQKIGTFLRSLTSK